MDERMAEAARSLSVGDPLGALKRIALLDTPEALALRGVALAQLGGWEEAKGLLRRATRAFGPGQPLQQARCTIALAEVSLASRDLGAWPAEDLPAALETLERHGDSSNAGYARVLEARLALLSGRLDAVEQVLAAMVEGGSPRSRAVAGLVAFELLLRRRQARSARTALEEARRAAHEAAIPALVAEVERALASLDLPAARLTTRGRVRDIVLEEIESLLTSDALVVDGCERAVRTGHEVVGLASRPVLFSLLRTLALAYPDPASRERLIEEAFGGRTADGSHRARLRVEVGRLRRELGPLADVRAAGPGFELAPRTGREVFVLTPPADGLEGVVLALLSDGERWSTSALALASGASPRTVQRTLSSLEEAGKTCSVGSGRARRWVSAPRTRWASSLLLPARIAVR